VAKVRVVLNISRNRTKAEERGWEVLRDGVAADKHKVITTNSSFHSSSKAEEAKRNRRRHRTRFTNRSNYDTAFILYENKN